MLAGRKILVGICGSIAAYKSIFLVRLLIKSGAEVKVVLTPAAHDFVTPVTLATLSRNPVMTEFVKDASGTWHNHVELGMWADLLLVAPASANTMAKSAHGHCDNLLSAIYLSARCPVWWAPAMDLDMYRHPSTSKNIALLSEHGDRILAPGSGELASGLVGQGRMMEPEEMISKIERFFDTHSGQIEATDRSQDFKGQKILITAGPTQEAIDPVRFISNHSSGKMGYAIAGELAARGATVELVSGPVNIPSPHPDIRLHKVTSANEMYLKCSEIFPECTVAIFSAAVADYTPSAPSQSKIKKADKDDGRMALILEETPDIASLLGARKSESQTLVGFALETDNELENAKGKLRRKNLDMVVLNSLNDKAAGFGHETNKVTVVRSNGESRQYGLKSKIEVAKDVVNELKELMNA